MINIIHWLCGYIEFECSGGFTERFYNLCYAKDIELWNTKSISKILTARTDEKNLTKIKNIADETKNIITIKSNKGLPPFLRKNKNRIGLPVGLVLFLCVLRLLSSFIWNIEIFGIKNISEVRMYEILESSGVFEGQSKNKVDKKSTEIKITKENPDISWISINFEGTNAVIKLSEKSLKPKEEDKVGFCNIKAKENGKILQINTKSGTSVCKVGDGIKKGDLLISGVVESSMGFSTIVHAQGEIIAETNYKIEISYPLNYSYQKPLKDSLCLRGDTTILNFKVPYKMKQSPGENYKSQFFSEKVYINESFLPIKVKNEKMFLFLEENVKSSNENIEKILMTQLALRELAMFENKEIIKRDITMKTENSTLKIFVSYVCKEDIGYDDKIDISEDMGIIGRENESGEK